jgi:hypothetical protein
LDDLNSNPLIVRQYNVTAGGESLPIDYDAGGGAWRDSVPHDLAAVNCHSPNTEKFLESKVSDNIGVDVYRPRRVTSRER